LLGYGYARGVYGTFISAVLTDAVARLISEQ
jgi:hypothetical protein